MYLTTIRNWYVCDLVHNGTRPTKKTQLGGYGPARMIVLWGFSMEALPCMGWGRADWLASARDRAARLEAILVVFGSEEWAHSVAPFMPYMIFLNFDGILTTYNN